MTKKTGSRRSHHRITFTLSAILAGAIVIILYITYFYTPPVTQRKPAYLKRIDSYFVEAGSFRIHYIHKGSGEPVVLLPGGYLWIYQYRKIIPALAKHFSVYAFDLPGNGYSAPLSPQPDYDLPAMDRVIAEFLNKLNLNRVTLVGHSWGGGMALYFAEQHPERVAKLVLISSTGASIGIQDPLSFRILKWPLVGRLLSKFITKGVVRTYLKNCVYHDSLVTDEMVRQIYIPLTFRYARRMTYQMYRQLNWNLTARNLARVQAPTLLIWGAKDEIEPVKAGKALEKHIPKAKLIVLGKAKHCVTEDRPKDIVRLITDFVKEQS